MRYQMLLAPCPATDKKYWGLKIGEGHSIVNLWDNYGDRPNGYSWEQVIEILDTKTGKKMTQEDYWKLVRKLKGWEK